MNSEKKASIKNKISNSIINEVNPKYRYYDRPVFLAVIVGFICYGIAIAYSLRLKEDSCTQENMLASGKEIGVFLKNTQYDCVYYTDVFSKESLRLDGCKIEDMVIDENYGSVVVSKIPFCSGNGPSGETPNVCPFNDNGQIVKVSYRKCDSYGTSLGAAMGYLDIFKIVIGMIIVKIFTALRVVKLIQTPQQTQPPVVVPKP